MKRAAQGVLRAALQATVSLAAVMVLTVCSGDSADQSDGESGEGVETVRGLVLEVDARSLLEVESLRVEDKSGVIWLFEGRGRASAEFTPSHIREHMVNGLPVTVTFRREGGVLTIIELGD